CFGDKIELEVERCTSDHGRSVCLNKSPNKHIFDHVWCRPGRTDVIGLTSDNAPVQASATKLAFSPSDLTAFLACEHLTALDLRGARGESLSRILDEDP